MVSAIARANEQLLASERLATIGKMAAHVTHEIRNPLSSIALNLELLEEELNESGDEARALLRAITKEVDRLSALSTQYLSVAKRQQLRLEEENIGDVVREACDFVRGDLVRNGLALNVNIEPDLPLVKADEAQLKQALFNLLRNAREAMQQSELGRAGSVEVTLVREQSGVRIAVDDEGTGIESATKDKLFEPFFSTKSHGTGLGLAITREIVEAHGGSISCEARPERGTRFVIQLPKSDDTESPDLPRVEPRPLAGDAG
jgi:two-component system NtrC family sensor kinase